MGKRTVRTDPRKVATADNVKAAIAAGIQTGVHLSVGAVTALRDETHRRLVEAGASEEVTKDIRSVLDGAVGVLSALYEKAESDAERTN